MTLLVERYGANASRLHHLLQCIMRPEAFPQDAAGFEVARNEWEHLVQRWEILATDLLNDAVKRQILLDMASLWHQSPADSGRPNRATTRCVRLSCHTSSPLEIRRGRSEQRAPQEHLRCRWRWTRGQHLRWHRQGRKALAKSPRKPGDGKPCYVCGKQDTLRKIAGNGRCKPRESRIKGKEKAKGKNGGNGEGNVSNVSDEPTDKNYQWTWTSLVQ